VTQILCRAPKNNPVLLGEAGVGQYRPLSRGWPKEIARGNGARVACATRFDQLDLALDGSPGTKYRGQFEERIKAVMDEIRRSKNIILSSTSCTPLWRRFRRRAYGRLEPLSSPPSVAARCSDWRTTLKRYRK